MAAHTVQKRSRFHAKTPAQLFMASASQLAQVHNVSVGGLFVSSQTLWAPGTRVQTLFALPDGAVNALCRVVHVLDVEHSLAKLHPPGMGMQFETLNGQSSTVIKAFVDRAMSTLMSLHGSLTPTPVDLPQLVALPPAPMVAVPVAAAAQPLLLNPVPEPFRQQPRWRDEHTVCLHLEQGAMEEGFVANISQGGMFVETSQPPPRGSMVSVEIGSGGGMVKLQAEVVHVLDAQQAAGLGQRAGVGLQFVDLKGEKRAALEAYVAGRALGLTAELADPAPSAAAVPLDRLMVAVKRLFDGLEREDGAAALGLSVDASVAEVDARVSALDDLFASPAPDATAPQQARIGAARKALPKVAAGMLRAVEERKRGPSVTKETLRPPPPEPPVEAAPPLAEPPVSTKSTPAGRGDKGANTLWDDAQEAERREDLVDARHILTLGQRTYPLDGRFAAKLKQVVEKIQHVQAHDLITSAEVLSDTPGMKSQAAGRAQEAMQLLRSPEILRRALQVFLKVGNHQAAVSLAREFIQQDRMDPAPYQALLTVYETAGHWQLALHTLEKLLYLKPNDAELKKRLKHVQAQINS